MQKSMRKLFSFVLILISSMFILVACGESAKGITKEDLENLVFEDGTFDYDEQLHSIYVDNIYEDQGVVITYIGNNVKLPGTYNVTAVIKYEELKVQKNAKIVINKLDSVLEAEEEQVFYLSNKNVELQYSLNNTKQEVKIFNEKGKEVTSADYSRLGTYKLELYAKGNTYYKESNHVFVTVKVIKSLFDVEFESQTYVADGTAKKLELKGELPSDYVVEYENVEGTEPGKYYGKAFIKNLNGEVIETRYAVLTIEVPADEAFDEYLETFFVDYLSGDQLSINIFCENPESFGFEHYDAEWYTFDAFNEEDIEHDLKIYEEALEELRAFKDANLNELQKSAYITIEKQLQYYVDYYSIEDVFFMQTLYIDQFGGYIADFATYMESYSLRTELEVQDIIDYINSTKDAFASYVKFANAKLEKGYGYSDFTLKEMRKFLKDILDQGDNYYLKDIINAKIDKVDFLTNEEKAAYKDQVAKAISESFIVGVQALYDGLEPLIGTLAKEDEGYLTNYENGKEIYLLELKDLFGIDDFDIDEYIRKIDKELDTYIKQVIATQDKIVGYYNITSGSQFDVVLNKNSIVTGTPEEMLVYLKEFAKTIVPELKSDPDIVVKEMDEASAKVSNAVAYYMKSALDNTGSEYITLNPVKLQASTNNSLLETLAHEGYPGHLYAYVFSKEAGLSNIATVMTSTAHGEGWATYVEIKLYEYAKSLSDDYKFDAVMDYYIANALSSFLLETRLDVGIHYEGWTEEQVADYMDNLGYNGDAAGEIVNLLIEMPASYAAYGYGKVVMNGIHQEAKNILGAFYDEVEFNAMVLSKGWTNLGILQDTYEAYMIDKCFECGIEYK